MRLGIIARYDEGGLGTQTWEYARHLQPAALLMLDVPPGRGEPDESRYEGLAEQFFWSTFPLGPDDGGIWRRFALACDVVLTAETYYWDEFPYVCADSGTKLVVHANPELWPFHASQTRPPFTTWVPTDWMTKKLGHPEVVPVPVDRERCEWRHVETVRTMLHVSAPAFHDRNGTNLVKDALPHCRTSFTLQVAGPDIPSDPVQIGNVTVQGIGSVRDYWTIYDDADALVLPRRYGGLCLPMQEAASCGLPIISLRLPPQRAWLHDPLLIQEQMVTPRVRMKGGPVNVWGCDARLLAAAMDALVAGDHVEAGGDASDRWAESIDWKVWETRYRQMLERV